MFLDNIMLKKLWDKKNPDSPREKGALGLLDVKWYNTAFESSKLAKYWSRLDKELSRIAIEQKLAVLFPPENVFISQNWEKKVIFLHKGVWTIGDVYM